MYRLPIELIDRFKTSMPSISLHKCQWWAANSSLRAKDRGILTRMSPRGILAFELAA